MAGLGSLPRLLGAYADSKTSAAYITPCDPKTDTPVSDQTRFFQYFPETINDTKENNWANKEIPGGSLPLYQWVAGGARTLTFRAVFTSDTDPSVVPDSRLKGLGLTNRNVDVNAAVLWLRSFTMPLYDGKSQVGSPITRPPRKLMLTLPNTGIGFCGGQVEGMSLDEDTILCFMNECSVEYTSFWPSGYTRIASVNLGFTQIAQMGGYIAFPQYTTTIENAIYKGYGGVFRGYQMTPKAKGAKTRA